MKNEGEGYAARLSFLAAEARGSLSAIASRSFCASSTASDEGKLRGSEIFFLVLDSGI